VNIEDKARESVCSADVVDVAVGFDIADVFNVGVDIDIAVAVEAPVGVGLSLT
jgi:hypothetical protein